MNLIDRVSTEFDKYGKYIAFATVAVPMIPRSAPPPNKRSKGILFSFRSKHIFNDNNGHDNGRGDRRERDIFSVFVEFS
jgi:hypothetical protein